MKSRKACSAGSGPHRALNTIAGSSRGTLAGRAPRAADCRRISMPNLHSNKGEAMALTPAITRAQLTQAEALGATPERLCEALRRLAKSLT